MKNSKPCFCGSSIVGVDHRIKLEDSENWNSEASTKRQPSTALNKTGTEISEKNHETYAPSAPAAKNIINGEKRMYVTSESKVEGGDVISPERRNVVFGHILRG